MNDLTKDKPTRPGFYWLLRYNELKVVLIERHLTANWLKVKIPGSAGYVNLEYLNGAWWSREPIQAPAPPKGE